VSFSNLPVEALVMAVSPNSILPNVFKTFYDLISENYPDPSTTARNPSCTQFIFSSYPEADIDDNRVKFPLIIIEPADMKNEPFTQTKKKSDIDLTIRCFDTRMEMADKMLNRILTILDSNIWYLKNQKNLHYLTVDNTDTDWYYRQGTRVHIRYADISMQYIYPSGLGLSAKQKTLVSNARIA
jgi:hypothetical protein